MRNKRTLVLAFGWLLLVFVAKAQTVRPLSSKDEADVKNYIQQVENYKASGDKNETARYLNKLANLYWEHYYLDNALDYFSQSVEVNQQLGNKNAVRSIYNYMGMIYADKKDYQQSIHMYEQALTMVRQAGRRDATMVEALKNIAFAYESLADYPQALTHLEEAAEIAKEMNNMALMRTCYFSLADLHDKAGNSEKSAAYFSEFNKLDKILVKEEAAKKSQEAERQVAAISSSKREVESRLEGVTGALEEADSLNELRMSQIQLLEQEKEIVDLKIKEQEMQLANERLARNSAILGVGLSLIIAMVLLWAYGQKKKSNEKLEEKNREIVAQQKEIEIEKEKSDKLLLNILPHATAQELKDKGQATPRHYDQVTVMFTDFVGFTRIAEKMSPAQLVRELGQCFLAFDEIVENHGLEKIKTIGDSYMCAGGIPVVNDNNPVETVQAALDIKAFMDTWNAEKIQQGETPWELRIGIHTGSLVAGVIGKKKFAYDIWGDAVNTASRLESSGQPGKINVSGATYSLIQNDFECTYRGKIEAKNKGEVDMYFVDSRIRLVH